MKTRERNAINATRLKKRKKFNNEQSKHDGYIVAFKEKGEIYGASRYRDSDLNYRNFMRSYGNIISLKLALEIRKANKDRNAFIIKTSRTYPDIVLTRGDYYDSKSINLS